MSTLSAVRKSVRPRLLLLFNLLSRFYRAAWLAVTAILFSPSPVHAQFFIDRSQCKQYGGPADCYQPVIGPWKYDACGEVGAFIGYEIAVRETASRVSQLVLANL